MPTQRSFLPRALRAPVSLSAEVRAVGAAPEHAAIVNMSASGALVELARPAAIGDQLALRFAVPGMTAVEAVGHVARIEGNRVGVAFDGLADREAELVHYHVMVRRPALSA